MIVKMVQLKMALWKFDQAHFGTQRFAPVNPNAKTVGTWENHADLFQMRGLALASLEVAGGDGEICVSKQRGPSGHSACSL